MKNLKRFTSLALILVITASLTGCGKQTTLDRIASVLRVAADGFQIQLDQLKAQGVIDEEKYNRLSAKSAAIKRQADELGRVISGFGAISPGDIPRILQQIELVVAAVESALTDPAWTGADAVLGTTRTLHWLRATLTTASLVVAALFPPQPSPSIAAGVKSISPAKVKIDLPRY